MRKQLLKKLMNDRKNGLTISDLAHRIGLPYTTMHRILSGKNGNITNWEKIASHYERNLSKKVSA